MTEKKSDFADKLDQSFPSTPSTFKNSLGFYPDFEPVVDTMPNHPYNIIFRGSQEPNVLFLVFRKLLIHKEIAQQLGAFHAQRTKTVAMTPMAQGQRELQFVEIQLSHIGRLVNDEFFWFLQF